MPKINLQNHSQTSSVVQHSTRLVLVNNMDKGSLFQEKAGKEEVRMNLALRTETTNLILYFSLLCITFLRYILYETQECKLHLVANTYKKTARIN